MKEYLLYRLFNFFTQIDLTKFDENRNIIFNFSYFQYLIILETYHRRRKLNEVRISSNMTIMSYFSLF